MSEARLLLEIDGEQKVLNPRLFDCSLEDGAVRVDLKLILTKSEGRALLAWLLRNGGES